MLPLEGGGLEGFHPSEFPFTSLLFVLPFAEFALRTGEVHGVHPMLMAGVFIRHS